MMAKAECYDKEMTRALERHKAGTARVIPVILRPVDWHTAPFGKLQALPRDGKPVTSWKSRDEAFVDIARGIREVVVSLAAGAQNPSTSNQDEALPKNLEPLPSQLRNKSERLESEQLITFLENKRVLYSPVSSRCPGGVIKSVQEIRDEVQRVREHLLRKNLVLPFLSARPVK